MLHHHGPSTLITRTHTDGLWSSKKVIRIKARSATEIGLNTFSRLREFPHAQRYVMQPRKSFFSQYLYVMIIITVHMASGAMIVSANKYTYICTEPGKKKQFPGCENFVLAVAFHFCLALFEKFSQPGNHSFAGPCTCQDSNTTHLR